MTATQTTIETTPDKRLVERLRQVAAAAGTIKSAIGARWRAEIAAGSFGPDHEAVIGRGTGARV